MPQRSNQVRRRSFLVAAPMLAGGVVTGAFSMTQQQAPGEWTVPPEESRHALTLMQWPASRRVHPNREFRELLQQTIVRVANAIAQFEPVVMMASAEELGGARRLFSATVEHWDIPTEDLWCRDAGPLIAKRQDGTRVVSHIQFNGWGNRQLHRRDARIARRVAERLGLSVIDSGLVGEAGGVEHDGHGLLMAHESSWVNKNRNPGLSREQIEQHLLRAYGARQMIWSPGVAGQDITDYHIDSLARFTGPGKVLINLPDSPDRDDPFHRAAVETHDRLVQAGLEVDVIPEPLHRRIKSLDFVASYANYYVCNDAVIAAQFGDRTTDQLARAALRNHYPEREVVMLNVDAIGEVGGGIHCATQQVPL